MDKTEIKVKDGNTYFFTTAPFNALNPLGVVKATLKEYSIYKNDTDEIFIGKLYKTKEGSWYGFSEINPINPLLATFIKMAIDESEKAVKTTDKTLL